MNRHRQNIQSRNSIALKINVLEEYGMTPREAKTDRKQLKSKSKLPKDILIAKNKKLPQSFKTSRMNLHEVTSPKHRQVKSSKKTGQFFQIWQKNSAYMAGQEKGFNGLKTSQFGDDPNNNKENTRLRSSKQIIIRPQTYASDRVQAFELRQRLKKSTSMRNLIEQRFMYGSQNEQVQKKQIEANDSKPPTKEYDSTKYNWRLSKSKQKLEKQKSLSALSCKAKLMCDLQKKQANRCKLTLDNPVETNSENRFKLKSQQILSFDYNPQVQQKEAHRVQGKTQKNLKNLSYTFGSDVMNSLQFG